MRRRVAYVAGVILLSMLVIAVSCGGDDSVNLIFNQGPSDCATANQSAATIKCDGGVFNFEGLVITSNPCNYLKAEMGFINGSSIMIEINAVSTLARDSSCAECLGEISFNGTVELSGACSKSLLIVYNGTTIAEYEQGD